MTYPTPQKFFSKSFQPPNPNRIEAHPSPKLRSIVSSTLTNHRTMSLRELLDFSRLLSKVSLDFVKSKGATCQSLGAFVLGLGLLGQSLW